MTRKAMKEHSSVHTDPALFSCELCGLAFATQLRLDRHKVSHTGERAFRCGGCGLSFSWKKSLNSHQRQAHPELFYGLPAKGPCV
jgi:KRAB domain-containing zinc finger protein